jgi:cytochrome c-type biogenesis protein CcmH/NrfG
MRSKKVILFLSAIIITLSLTLYYYLGNPQGLHNALLLGKFNESIEQGMDDPKILQELILGLHLQLEKYPNDPMSLALLGKIYFTLGDYANAKIFFAKAYKVLPNDAELLIDYTTANYLANEGVINPGLAVLLEKVKQLEPTLASLSLLANVALSTGDTKQAIIYWQTMQQQVPKNDPLYQELTLTIDFAQENNNKNQ